jgi:transposase-like protein
LSTQKKNLDQSDLDKIMSSILEAGVDLSTVLDKDGLLKQLTKGILEKALQVEMKDHLGYDKHERSDTVVSNARNGYSNKTLKSEHGNLEISVPRDRTGKFEPAIVPKRQTRINGLDNKIISLYAKGMSVADIKTQLEELYEGVEISTGLISQVTEAVMDEVKDWQNRPLDKVYPIVYFDCLVVKVKQDRQVINKAIYLALGIDANGLKDILGMWISENEGAKFWLNNLTELKNRGLLDILIACTDNLSGMNEAISAVYPKTEHQLCIVHQIRNSCKFVSYKDRKKICADLKAVYTSPTADSALSELDNFAKQWDSQYPYIAKSWYNNWDNLAVFFDYPEEIRRIIYTTNAIESLNNQLRKVTKNKRSFPTDDAVFKTLYLAITYISRKWTMPLQNWGYAMGHFMIKFEGRI